MAVITTLQHWGKKNWVILSNASSMVGSSVVTSGLGFVYWWLAARQFPQEAVGLTSALISAMSLLGTLAMLGLGTLLMGELPRQPEKRGTLIVTALLVAAAAGTVFGLLFAMAAPRLSDEFGVLAANVPSAVFFTLGVSLTAVTLVLDQALIGVLRGGLQLWRNFLFALFKLVVLFVFGFFLSAKTGLAIYATWTIGNILSLVLLAGYAVWKFGLHPSHRPQFSLLRGLRKAALGHHALNMALMGPGMMLPVLVTAILSVTANAYFYIAWMMASLVFMGPMALSTVLYAVGAANRALLAQKIQFTLKLALSVGVLANVVLMFGAELLLSLFGASYASEAAWPLRILALGVFPVIIKDHFVAVGRIHNRLLATTLPVVAGGCLELGLAATGASLGGLSGLIIGWLIANCIEGLVLLPTVWKAARTQPTLVASKPEPQALG